jgi:diketogulonate reductase-like aldo/keto reductase
LKYGKYEKLAATWKNRYYVVAIPGATKEIHVKENCGSMSFSLSDEDMALLDNVSAIFK